jgi:transposase
MVQQITDNFWQAEARSEETKKFIQDIKRATRRKFTPEEKIAIVLEGFRRDTAIRDLCRREGIHQGPYYAWLEDFMEAGKERFTRDTVRDATKGEVHDLKRDNTRLKQLVAHIAIMIVCCLVSLVVASFYERKVE